MRLRRVPTAFAAAVLPIASTAAAPFEAPTNGETTPAFDIVATDVAIGSRWLRFSMTVEAEAGGVTPEPVGALAGTPVEAYVWPLDLDPAVAGFPEGSGRLAFVVTNHPDFDDTPLFDENQDGRRHNDGGIWHSHRVVLVEDESCGGGLKVRDLDDTDPAAMPPTWPEMAIHLSSPGYSPRLEGGEVRVRVPFAEPARHEAAAFDGVTAALQVNPELEAPLLCVTALHDVAAGDLSLPGRGGRWKVPRRPPPSRLRGATGAVRPPSFEGSP